MLPEGFPFISLIHLTTAMCSDRVAAVKCRPVQHSLYRNYRMFSDTLCLRTPPIFHRDNNYLASVNMFFETLCFRTPPIFSPK